MANYIQIEFQNISSEQSDLLVAQLNEIGFSGFEEEENNLKAFIPANDFTEVTVKEIAASQSISFTQSVIEETNWNAVWESNFQPVIVDDFVGIRADFHEPIIGVEHEIVITPKMSFGTGHHATTFMMIQRMREIDFAGKTVFDFGTGTGVLAILAEKLGADKIIAVDNDDWSISNAAENIDKNQCRRVQLMKADNAIAAEKFHIILANINKNVIVDNFTVLAGNMETGATLLLSGLMKEDKADIWQLANQHNVRITKEISQGEWICLSLNH
jgi:ribosomal protein L11 methyltransferase